MIRLVCIDVDGTLVGRAGTVDDAVWAAARRARDRGIRLAICTGRPGFGLARGWAERLDADGWHVFQNGASVLELATGASRSSPLPRVAIDALVVRARATGRVLELYADREYVVESTGDRARDHAALLGVAWQPRRFEALGQAPVRAQWLVPLTELDAVLAEPHPGLDAVPSTSPVMPDTMFINLTAAGVGKDSGVRSVARAHGLELGDVMVVGDALNDLAAMAAVGFPVAMGNAEPQVLQMVQHRARQNAGLVVGDVDDGGLVEALNAAVDAAGDLQDGGLP